MNLDTYLTPHRVIHSKQIPDLNVRLKLEDNTEVKLCELRLQNGFLDTIAKAQEIKEKIDKDFIKILNFWGAWAAQSVPASGPDPRLLAQGSLLHPLQLPLSLLVLSLALMNKYKIF